jgi:hypothetical protein
MDESFLKKTAQIKCDSEYCRTSVSKSQNVTNLSAKQMLKTKKKGGGQNWNTIASHSLNHRTTNIVGGGEGG